MGYRRFKRARGGDPHWIACRRRGFCHSCGAAIARGGRAFYVPSSGTLYGAACCGKADEASRRFEAEAFDDAQRGAA